MAHRDDSYVFIFVGPRGGGKTLSMVVQSVIEMLRGRPVFSNFPIGPIRVVFDDGTSRVLESRPFEEDAFITQDPAMFGGVIAWDEMPLSLHNREFATIMNRLAGKVITLLRKQQQSLLITSQFTYMVDKNVRVQCDAEIYCSDLSFKYPGMERGEYIGQDLKDISGRLSGTPYDASGETVSRVLMAKPFWGAYDTLRGFDVLKAQQKVRISVGYRDLVRADLVLGESEQRATALMETLQRLPINEMFLSDIAIALAREGFHVDTARLKEYLRAIGWVSPRHTMGY